MSDAAHVVPTSRLGDPPWEIAQLFPEQGFWDEHDYLALNTTRLVEFDNGMIEVLPMPKKAHQKIIAFLLKLLEAFIVSRKLGGLVLPAGYKLRIPGGKYREPDILYMTAVQDAGSNEDFTDKAELVMEVVSEDDPGRDYIKKRADYARAGVPEYWIVDASARHIVVLRLQDGAYAEHGRFSAGQKATSSLLPEFELAVDDMLRLVPPAVRE